MSSPKKNVLILWLTIIFAVATFSCQQHREREQIGPKLNKLSVSYETFRTGENNYVRSLAVDKNDLWVGTSSGALHIDRKKGALLHTYTRKDGLKNEYIFTIAIDNNGVKWFGTNAGGLSRFDGSSWKTYVPMHGLADYWIYDIDFESDGTMWIGTWAGVNRFDGKNFKTWSVKDGLVNEWVYGVAIDKDNIKWFGTEGGVSRFDGNTWKSWTNKDGLGEPNGEKLESSYNTGLGTRNRHNLSILGHDGGETYMVNYVFCALVDKNNNKWFGTWGGGVSKFDGMQFTNYTRKDGLAGNVVYAMEEAENGALWFATDKGVSKFYNGRWESFLLEDGLLDHHVYTIAIDADDNIWLGQRGGVVKLTERTAVKTVAKPIQLLK